MRRWTAPELAVLDWYVKLLRDGKYRLVKHAVVACMRELARKFTAGKRSNPAVDAAFKERRRSAGDLYAMRRWTEAELAVLDRHVKLRRGPVNQAVAVCMRDLRKKCPEGKRTRSAVVSMFKERRRAVGDVRVLRRWTEPELAVLDRHAELVRNGAYGSVRQTTAECVRALAKKYPAGKRSAAAVATVFNKRRRAMGDLVLVPPWSEIELAILDRHIRLLRSGKYQMVKQAVAVCMREFRKKCPEGKRSVVAVMTRMRDRRKAAGDSMRPDLWIEDELAIIDRFARAFDEGRYIRTADAIPECRAELDRLWRRRGNKTPRLVQRGDNQIAVKLQRRRRDLGIFMENRHWSDAELHTVDQYARAVVEGRYASCRAATTDCKAELDRWREAHPNPRRPLPVRDYGGVLGRLLQRAHRFRPIRKTIPWTDAELAIVDRYARRLLKGSLKTVLQATQKCAVELARKTGPGVSKDGSGILRSDSAINFCLYRRLHQAGRQGKSEAAWSPREYAIRDRVLRAWKRSQSDARPWHRRDAALRLQQRLQTHGFKRTLLACWGAVHDNRAGFRTAEKQAPDTPAGE
jgi:hypothetical protein